MQMVLHIMAAQSTFKYLAESMDYLYTASSCALSEVSYCPSIASEFALACVGARIFTGGFDYTQFQPHTTFVSDNLLGRGAPSEHGPELAKKLLDGARRIDRLLADAGGVRVFLCFGAPLWTCAFFKHKGTKLLDIRAITSRRRGGGENDRFAVADHLQGPFATACSREDRSDGAYSVRVVWRQTEASPAKRAIFIVTGHPAGRKCPYLGRLLALAFHMGLATEPDEHLFVRPPAE